MVEVTAQCAKQSGLRDLGAAGADLGFLKGRG